MTGGVCLSVREGGRRRERSQLAAAAAAAAAPPADCAPRSRQAQRVLQALHSISSRASGGSGQQPCAGGLLGDGEPGDDEADDGAGACGATAHPSSPEMIPQILPVAVSLHPAAITSTHRFYIPLLLPSLPPVSPYSALPHADPLLLPFRLLRLLYLPSCLFCISLPCAFSSCLVSPALPFLSYPLLISDSTPLGCCAPSWPFSFHVPTAPLVSSQIAPPLPINLPPCPSTSLAFHPLFPTPRHPARTASSYSAGRPIAPRVLLPGDDEDSELMEDRDAQDQVLPSCPPPPSLLSLPTQVE